MADIFSKSVSLLLFFFLKKPLWNISRVSSCLDPDHARRLIWVQIVCKGYQQTTLVSKEFMMTTLVSKEFMMTIQAN